MKSTSLHKTTLFGQCTSAKTVSSSLLQVSMLNQLTGSSAMHTVFNKYAMVAGYGKVDKFRIYNLANPCAEPEKLQGSDPVRFASFHQNDTLILSTYVDKPNIR